LHSSEMLAAAAYLALAKGKLDAAQALLNGALKTYKDDPVLLLWTGYCALCSGQFEIAVQYLQKCLRQPASLAFSAPDRGQANLYLAVAWHLYREANSKACAVECKEWVKQGLQLQPALHQALNSTSKLGGLSLLEEHARVLARYMKPEVALAPALVKDLSLTSALAPVRMSPRRNAAGPLPMPGLSLPTSQVGPLLGTASTGVPASSSPSRQTSEPGSLVGTATSSPLADGSSPCGADLPRLASSLPVDKVLSFAEIEFGDIISRGKVAVVCHARLGPERQDVVAKSLHIQDCPEEDEQAAKELMSEIAIMADLNHPRLIPFVGATFQSGIVLVTALAAGGNLHQAIHANQRQFCRSERFELSGDLFEGVRYLHFRQPAIVHLDLKSMNLLLNSDGRLQICDFGLARTLGAGTSGCPGSLPEGGTARYMPPECHDATVGPITVKADIWSAGCVLIEIFGECLPFAECNGRQQIVKALLVDKCRPIVPESVEESVRRLLDAVLAMGASGRPAAASVLEYLQEALKQPRPDSSRFQWCP